MSFLKAPFVKQKGFSPMPVVRGRVPKYADSRLNKKVIGTPAWEEYWNEQLYYCHNGYQTGGLFLPGRFYHYLNFNSMATGDGVITPDFVDLHLELAYLIEHCKKTGKNIICAKKRRAGISEATHKMVVDYGWRFFHGYQAGVAAGQDIYAQDFMKKWRSADSLIVPEFRTKKLLNNDNEVIAGYEIKNEDGSNEEGTKNTIYVRTMFKNPNLFKGLYLNDIIAEEAGEFEKLKEFYRASMACTKIGSKIIGNFYIYGTGGQIDKGSKDFKEMWYEPDTYNCEKFLILGGRFHPPFYGGCSYDKPIIPNLSKKYKPFETHGMEDVDAAINALKEERAILSKGSDRKGYLEHLQNYPLEEKDIFKKVNVNNFDPDKLNDQDYAIASNPRKWSKWKLEWVKDDNNLIKTPRQVVAVPVKDGDDSAEIFLILDSEHPRKTHSNLYVAGIDSYDQDIAKTSKSLGAMCVLIRDNNIPDAMKKAPVAVICTRPRRKEIFYDMCLRLAVYYNIKDNVLGDVAKPQILKYTEDRSLMGYMARRPKKFESPNSEQSHDYWVSLNSYSRPMMVALMESAVYYNADQIWFNHTEEYKNGVKIQCDLINQLGNFDETEVGSDNDLADAYGIALMQDVSCELRVVDEKDIDWSEKFGLFDGYHDVNGNYIPEGEKPELKTDEQDHGRFGL